MKKIVSGIFIFLFLSVLQNSCSASEVSFIYINGSNNNNEKMKNWFEKGVNKLHPVLKKRFEENEQIKQLMLSSEGLNIAENPEIFFWGDLSKTDLDFVHQQLDISKNFSPTVAYQVRSLITQYMHDAIWVQKSHHMQPIVQNLNEKIKKEQEAGRSVILYGYSAGTFITYEYLFNTLTYINLSELFNAIKVSDEVREFVKNNPRKDTCIAALAEGKIGVVSSGGKLIFDNNDESLKKHYLEMDIATEKVCSPKGAVRGVVNFASPLVLFYSDLADSDYELTYYNKLMLKYIMENGLFMLTVNFREDPLGFPTSKNLTYEEMEELLKFQFANPSGFVFDNSSAWSWRPFFLAHTSYWSAKKQFSKAVVNSIVEGYRYQYDKTYRAKMQKKSKKYELL
ncbi:TPA: hypothetical protein IAD41_06295 [Candidatus Scatenecus faecavium]|uniref:Uncharacterized protein n=1 Tax=Candidatus Scatenecus faecavium TaxID=2840915 RepID=A0A9D1K454_9BACT|nr:hypothetical protein [Candidatus Scatenecus faecavium]